MTVLVYLEPRDGQRAHQEGQAWCAPYVCEVLAHAGISYEVATRASLAASLAQHRLLILPYDAPLDSEARNAVAAFLGRGALLGIAGTSGLAALFGVQGAGALGESYGAVTEPDVITGGVSSSLHGWGGVAVRADPGTQVLLRRQADGIPLLCRTPRTLFLAVDLPGTLVHLQQGLPIHQDGSPAPDGSAAIDDGILKTDDGVVLDWHRDRAAVEGHRCFLEPVGDDWRDLLLRGLFSLCREVGEPLPLLWYWPDDLPAVALLSHDTDGNVEALGWQELAAVERQGIQSSWCFIRHPETYPRRFYQTVAEHGHEVCLHYDAHSPSYPDATFAEQRFGEQLRWLRELLPAAAITSNKNHYLRWEGWTEPFRWMEASGISVDQSKGPSKQGNCGFLFGGSHPWFPLDDAAHGSRMLDVLEINLFAQDLIVAAPPELAEPLITRTRQHGGVAHFLFHPAHVAKTGVADAMAHTIVFAQQQGMPWWTSDSIGRWERARRQARLTVQAGTLRLTMPDTLRSATLLVLDTGAANAAPPSASWERVERWGFPFWRYGGSLAAELPMLAPGA